MRPLHVCALVLGSSLGCLDPGALANAAEPLAIASYDWNGRETPLDALARRPRLVLTGPIVPEDGTVLLLSGERSDALVDDLARAPLRSEHASRVVDCDVSTHATGIEIVPRVALDRDAPYLFVVAGWADVPTALATSALPRIDPLRTSAETDAGARVVGAWPSDGTHGVDVDLEAARVYLDGDARGVESGVWLEGPDGLAVPADVSASACDVGLPGARATTCVTLAPHGGLAPGTSHRLRVDAPAQDARGAPLGPWTGTWHTHVALDPRGPTALPLSCAVDEHELAWGCARIDDAAVSLRVRASEPVLGEVRIDGRSRSVVAPGGDFETTLAGLTPATPYTLELTLRDGAGHELRRAEEVATESALATLAIVEMRADPRGTEPAQEYVELLNYGLEPIPLAGFSLSDRADAHGEPWETDAVAHPGEHVLVVADDFDRASPLDAPPPPGATLLRVGAALGESGLANAGEPLYLRDPWGRRVSASPATPKPRPGACTVRVTDDMRDGRDGSFALDAGGECTPGR